MVWRTRTNELAYAMSVLAVTVNSNAAVGNAAIEGSFQANAIYATDVYGGSIGATSNLTFQTNVAFSGSKVNLGLAANVSITAGNATHRVLAVNTSTGALQAIRVSLSGDVSDANVSSPTNGQVFVFSTAENRWKNQDSNTITVGDTTSFGGQSSSYYTNASNISSGTLPTARLPNYLQSSNLAATYAALSHSHEIADVSGLQTALDGKAASSHTHTIANITNLQTTLDAKANTSLTASTTVKGLVELATNAETQTGTDATLAVTPAGLTAKEATVSDFLANVADRILTTDIVYSSQAEVTISYSATTTIDFSTLINGKITLTGNVAFANPTNQTGSVGKSGHIRITQDATGSRTATWGTNWIWANGTDGVLTTTAGATDILYYKILANGVIHASLVKAVS